MDTHTQTIADLFVLIQKATQRNGDGYDPKVELGHARRICIVAMGYMSDEQLESVGEQMQVATSKNSKRKDVEETRRLVDQALQDTERTKNAINCARTR